MKRAIHRLTARSPTAIPFGFKPGPQIAADMQVDANNDGTANSTDEPIKDESNLPGKVIVANTLAESGDNKPDYADMNSFRGTGCGVCGSHAKRQAEMEPFSADVTSALAGDHRVRVPHVEWALGFFFPHPEDTARDGSGVLRRGAPPPPAAAAAGRSFCAAAGKMGVPRAGANAIPATFRHPQDHSPGRRHRR